MPKRKVPKIIHKIDILASNPYPSGCKKLIGSEHTFRLRVNQYRIIYTVKDDILVVERIRICRRKSAYNN
ncbi:type II toxin-antitoxin system RelE/ParE family toxin [candidate division KSB1 bacterium]|nr:type II toxin-antitoxin system RelE/ParE family toxin [candidate division KSB1 bacterium]